MVIMMPNTTKDGRIGDRMLMVIMGIVSMVVMTNIGTMATMDLTGESMEGSLTGVMTRLVDMKRNGTRTNLGETNPTMLIMAAIMLLMTLELRKTGGDLMDMAAMDTLIMAKMDTTPRGMEADMVAIGTLTDPMVIIRIGIRVAGTSMVITRTLEPTTSILWTRQERINHFNPMDSTGTYQPLQSYGLDRNLSTTSILWTRQERINTRWTSHHR